MQIAQQSAQQIDDIFTEIGTFQSSTSGRERPSSISSKSTLVPRDSVSQLDQSPHWRGRTTRQNAATGPTYGAQENDIDLLFGSETNSQGEPFISAVKSLQVRDSGLQRPFELTSHTLKAY